MLIRKCRLYQGSPLFPFEIIQHEVELYQRVSEGLRLLCMSGFIPVCITSQAPYPLCCTLVSGQVYELHKVGLHITDHFRHSCYVQYNVIAQENADYALESTGAG